MNNKFAFRLYEICWRCAAPMLRLNSRLKTGYNQRILKTRPPQNVDLWIQSASAGEAYLAAMILNNLNPGTKTKLLLTSTTSQGIGILDRAVNDHIARGQNNIEAAVAYCPFDRPSIMEKAVKTIRPKVMVLIEAEIWPGLFKALKQHNSTILIVNGRMTEKSKKGYIFWPSLWQGLNPDRVLAISEDDAGRFAAVFGKENIDVMPNMKFDKIERTDPDAENREPVKEMLPPDIPFIVFGSVRHEEEKDIEAVIDYLHHRHSNAVIGLFPRHMHRIKQWQAALNRLNISWVLRSEIKNTVSEGTVILWDTFGELGNAYQQAKAVFVGGSLAPLGGQNFLEPLTCGVVPVIGPSWENFVWVGNDIIKKGLLRVADNRREVADFLSEDLQKNDSREKVVESIMEYVKERKGGTKIACELIRGCLSDGK